MSEFSDAIKSLLDEYGEEIKEEIAKAVENTAKKTDNYLETLSAKNTGAYAKNWSKTKIEATWHGVDVTVHNTRKPQLTHLLNDGWTMRNGQRHAGDGHIDKAEKYRQEELEKEVEALLKK